MSLLVTGAFQQIPRKEMSQDKHPGSGCQILRSGTGLFVSPSEQPEQEESGLTVWTVFTGTVQRFAIFGNKMSVGLGSRGRQRVGSCAFSCEEWSEQKTGSVEYKWLQGYCAWPTQGGERRKGFDGERGSKTLWEVTMTSVWRVRRGVLWLCETVCTQQGTPD